MQGLSDQDRERCLTGFSELLDTHYPDEFRFVVNQTTMKKRGGRCLFQGADGNEIVIKDTRELLSRGLADLPAAAARIFFEALWQALWHDMSKHDAQLARVAFTRLKHVIDGTPNRMLN